MSRRPIGITRFGQFLLGMTSAILGIGSAAGLYLFPKLFSPIVTVVLGMMSGGHLVYDEAHRALFAVLLVALGLLGAAMFAYAFIRQPKENWAIDSVLIRRDLVDTSRRATINPHDDISQ